MYQCECCGNVFALPKIIKESRGQCFGEPAYENVYVCPDCGSDDFEHMDTVYICPRCGWESHDDEDECPCCGYDDVKAVMQKGRYRCLRTTMSL